MFRYPLALTPMHALVGAPEEIQKLVSDYFAALQTHHLLKRCLHDVVIESFQDFIEALSISIIFLIIDPATQRACGHVTLNGRYGNVMMSHFSILPKYWGKQSHIIGKEALVQIAQLKTEDGSLYVSQLMGATPLSNPLAIKFSQKVLRYKPLGVIPDLCYMAYEQQYTPGVLSIKDLRGYHATVR